MDKQTNVDALALQAFQHMSEQSDRVTTLTTLFTPKEKTKIGRRILIAQSILAGKTRSEINEKLRVSPNTFAHIRRWLEDELQQYDAPQATKSNSSRAVRGRGQPYSYDSMKQRYPAHFLLLSLAEQLFKK